MISNSIHSVFIGLLSFTSASYFTHAHESQKKRGVLHIIEDQHSAHVTH